MLFHARASNMSASYKLEDVEADSEEDAYVAIRSRERRIPGYTLVGLQVRVFPHRPGYTCSHTSRDDDDD